MILFLLKVSFVIGIALLFYKSMLQQESFFAANRWYLLGCIVLAFILPYTTLPELVSHQGYLSAVFQADKPLEAEAKVALTPEKSTQQTNAEYQQDGLILPLADAEIVEKKTKISESPIDVEQHNWIFWLTMLYLFGVIVFTLNLLFQVGAVLLKVFKSTDKIQDSDCIIVNTMSQQAPCSFFRYIFIHPDLYDYDTYEQIIAHEKIHIRLGHSFDLFIAEVAVIILWFNPLIWLFKKEIEKNIEYQTDAILLEEEPVSKAQYQMNLLQIAAPDKPLTITTNYNQSLLKQRILMMNAKKSTLHRYWKYTFLAPVFFVTLLLMNEPAKSESTPTTASVPKVLQLDTTPVKSISSADLHRSWTATIEGEEVCFQFIVSKRGQTHHSNFWSNTDCFLKSEFTGLPTDSLAEFALRREAGTLLLKGQFTGGEGIGTFAFQPATAFVRSLEKEGFTSYTDDELIHFFFADIKTGYLQTLKSYQYNPDKERLLQLAIFDINENVLEKTLSDLKQLGYEQPELQQLIDLKIHDVDLSYIRSLEDAGYKDMDLEALTQAKIHGVDADFIQRMVAAGFSDLSLDELSGMAVHDISPAYIEELRQAGYQNLSAEEITEAKIHGVDADFIQSMERAGFTNLSLEAMSQMAVHDITPAYVAELEAAGYQNLSAEEVTEAKIHGVNAALIQDVQSLGLPTDDLDVVKQFAIHDVNPELVANLREMGYDQLSAQNIIEAAIHDITPDFARSYQALGFQDIPFQRLVELRIHDVSADFIKQHQKEGRTLGDYIRLKIMGEVGQNN